MNTSSSSSPSSPSPAPLFAALWALYFLIHELKQHPWPPDASPALSVLRLGVVLSAALVLADPRSSRRFASMVAIQVVAVCFELPAMSNCWLFTGFLGVGILGAYASIALRQGLRAMTLDSAYEAFAPTLRVSLLVLYAFAAFSKYNSDFFDPAVSCAAAFSRTIAASVSLSSTPAVDAVSIAGTLLVETALPILLVFARARRWAIALGMVFHIFLAHNHNIRVYDFSAMVFALYVSFAPADLMRFLAKAPRLRSLAWMVDHHRVFFPALAVATTALGLSGTLFGVDESVLARAGVALWFGLGGLMLATAIPALFSRNRADAPLVRPFRLRQAGAVVAVSLVTANGLAPYVGLKTGVAYTMFSNLRTERGYENHWVVPPGFAIFSYQDESARILSTDVPRIARLAAPDERVVFFALRAEAARAPAGHVVYERGGEVFEARPIAEARELTAPGWLERTLLYFRPIKVQSNTCQW